MLQKSWSPKRSRGWQIHGQIAGLKSQYEDEKMDIPLKYFECLYPFCTFFINKFTPRCKLECYIDNI